MIIFNNLSPLSSRLSPRNPMNNHLLFSATLATSLLFFGGCDNSRTSDYPDHSANTTRRVDDINRNARDQKDALDTENSRITTKMDFSERQIHEKYKSNRESLVNTSDKDATDRDAKVREIHIQAKHDKDLIDAETAEKLKTSPTENSAQIMANATNQKSEIDSKSTSKLSPLLSDAERSKEKIHQSNLEIDLNEAKEISALDKERSIARNEINEKKIKIDRWTSEELEKIKKDSSTTNK